MEEKEITGTESLDIIREMIDKSRQQLNDGSKYFFLWGFAVLGCAITQYVLLKNLQTNTQSVWILMPFIALLHLIMAMRERKKEKVVTHGATALRALWLALGISFFILAFLSFRISFNLFPFLILLYGIGTFVTGNIIEFRPLVFGGIACFILSILITYIDGAEQLLVLALSVVVAYILPAVLLKRAFINRQKN